MNADETLEIVNFTCQEGGRTARLMVRVLHDAGRKSVVGIECDNPRFRSLDSWQCSWPCWQAVQDTLDAG